MSYEELEYINSLTAERRERACRRAYRIDMAIRWGGWLLALVILTAEFAVRVS